MGKEPKKGRPKQPPPDTFTSGQRGPKQETCPPPDSAPSGRLRFEEGDTPPQAGATSGQHGPKPSGKFRQDTERPRPSNHMQREENADGDGGQEPHDKEAGPDRAGNKRADGEKRSDGKKPDKTEKAQEKANKAERKLESAREKLSTQKPSKQPGLAKKAVRGARAEVWFYTHNKIHEIEHENVGVEGAHKSELVAEAGTRKLVRFARRRYREHPARRVAKWERKELAARANLDFQKMAKEHPELASNPLSRMAQKWKLKRQYARQARQAAKQGTQAAKKTAATAGTITKRAVQAAARHPVFILIIVVLFLLFYILSAFSSLIPMLGSGLANAISGTSYASTDSDL